MNHVIGYLLNNTANGNRALVIATTERAARERFHEYFGLPADEEWDQSFEVGYTLISSEED